MQAVRNNWIVTSEVDGENVLGIYNISIESE